MLGKWVVIANEGTLFINDESIGQVRTNYEKFDSKVDALAFAELQLKHGSNNLTTVFVGRMTTEVGYPVKVIELKEE